MKQLLQQHTLHLPVQRKCKQPHNHAHRQLFTCNVMYMVDRIGVFLEAMYCRREFLKAAHPWKYLVSFTTFMDVGVFGNMQKTWRLAAMFSSTLNAIYTFTFTL